ncbi:MAG: pyridoxal-phosphate dependent enzyme [Acidobacteria bacterium]|nr:pyridoxal-phosphate dependent enzyme [Acidobacteriota bacterium]
MDVPARAVTLEAVREAATRIYPVARRTPMIRLDPIGRGEPEIFLKLEIFQPIGSFKLRGAVNAVAKLPASALADGVWTVSAGNAAQGVALAAREAGAKASVLVMDTAPATKIANIERLGATIHRATYDECWKTVEEHRSDRMVGRFIHPFDDDDFICGNGTTALEILDDVPDVDAVIASIGGGGLLAGIGCVMRALKPDAKVYAAEPETAAPLAASLAAGRPVRFDAWQASFVDGAGGRSVLPTMWPLLRNAVDHSIVVSLADTTAAMRLAAEQCHIIAEGAGACAMAAALSPLVRHAGHKRIVVVVSGGNIDLSRFTSLVTA